MSLNLPVAASPRRVLSKLRIVWAVMLFSLGMYVVVLRLIRNSSAIPPDRSFQLGLIVYGTVAGAVVLYMRFVRIARLNSPDESIDPKTLAIKANFNYIICFVLSEMTALCGFCLAFLNGDANLYIPLYLGGVLLMLMSYPRLPASESS